jgi:hypothetical protein
VIYGVTPGQTFGVEKLTNAVASAICARDADFCSARRFGGEKFVM